MYPTTLGQINTPTLSSTQSQLSMAGQYYNPGVLGIGSGFNINSALANGVSPQSMFDYQALQGLQGGFNIGTFGDIIGLIGGLGNMLLGFNNMSKQNDILDSQLNIANNQLRVAREEEDRIKRVRSKLSEIY